MRSGRWTIPQGFRRWRGVFDIRAASTGGEPPLRAALFSREQMEQHGGVLAASHHVCRRRGDDELLVRLGANERLLADVRTSVSEAVSDRRRITPAAEWLLDNFYLIEEQIRTARRHLPAGYSRELPVLADGPSAGLPRVYDLALETTAHGDGRLDLEGLGAFVAAYQTAAPLTLGELWAVPIMLRLALIENLRRVAACIGTDRESRNLAEDWADQMTAVAAHDPKSLILVVADMARSGPPMNGAFVAEFARRLQGRSPSLALPLTWVEQRLAEDGRTIDSVVQGENQQQAADQVSISNSIRSLRFLGATDWRQFVEDQSVVERMLRQDPAAVYDRMDFSTRDQYRHVTESLARLSATSEGDVARAAVERARANAAGAGPDAKASHVGFYLVDAGLAQLERDVGARPGWAERARRFWLGRPYLTFLGGIAVLTLLPAAAVLARLRASGMADWLSVGVGVTLAIAFSQPAVALVNAIIARMTRPRALPKIDLQRGIPADALTLVVVPTLLTSAAGVEHLAEALEVRFLGNRDEHLAFALLTDLADDADERTAADDALVQLAAARVSQLNAKYDGPFYLFHRPRRWNTGERVWMGRERKRGKLADLNSLLRGGSRACFSHIVGNASILPRVKYVITLDTDTQLPRDAARLMVGAMMHPLNRPTYDDDAQRVTEGYGILQPRVAISLPGTNRSRYARLWATDPGVDPYTRVVSDVYQDLFGEGSYIGKGIYEVDAFERAVGRRFPDNRILSHDLIEGCYARAGLLSDVQVYEDYPADYDEDVRRRYRWIRGDWQLWPWLCAIVPAADGSCSRNPVSALGRWKLFDNLRRSLVPAAEVALLLLAWAVFPAPWAWTTGAAAVWLMPAFGARLIGMTRTPVGESFGARVAATGAWAGREVVMAALTAACRPHEAWYSTDAALRSLTRTVVTHRRLLVWTASGARTIRSGLARTYARLWMAPALAGAVLCGLAWHRPAALAAAFPILLLWWLGPAAVWFLGRPLVRHHAPMTADQAAFLGAAARRTWQFFETYVGDGDRWLPPDNVQEAPGPLVAHRTSPTNMGLALLATLTAHDLGYVSTGGFLERVARTLTTMASLERFRGHFYNWYDTQSLAPLEPRYVSSVDSGNLAGHLLVLQAGLLAMPDAPAVPGRLFDGLRETLGLCAETLPGQPPPPLVELQRSTLAACTAPPTTLRGMTALLARLVSQGQAVVAAVAEVVPSEAARWAAAYVAQCQAMEADLIHLHAGPEGAPGAIDPTEPDAWGPTLRELAAVEGERGARARSRIGAIDRLAAQAAALAEMEWAFLYSKTRQLLAIGYSVTDRRRDSGYYDLLASEARLSVFVAIAQGQLPQESWFALGRLLTRAAGLPVLLSWSGSMFEYLMPLIVMPSHAGTLLDQTYQAVVRRQIEYGKECAVPWGISESSYNLLDGRLVYQYRAFGVPGLGLKRGLADDLVVAPYASALALLVRPHDACENLRRLASDGVCGELGFFEAVDYTSLRRPRGHRYGLVRSYMAHHQGMTLVSMANVLAGGLMQRRFAADPALQATALLLQERIPRAAASHVLATPASEARRTPGGAEPPVRAFTTPDTPCPEVQLLSNGRYHVAITNAGGGFSRWKDLAVTRWLEDTTRDHRGTFCFLRDVVTGAAWSTTHQPVCRPADRFEVVFTEARAEFRSRSHAIESYTEIAVSPEDDVELRRLHLTNCGRTRRTIEVTSYADIALAAQAAVSDHPTFSNLFVQTEIVADRQVILCRRRPRSAGEVTPWMFHVMAPHAETGASGLSYETDRARFIGRGRTAANPLALSEAGDLAGTQGSVLDPVVAIRGVFELDPDESVPIDMVFGVADTREACLNLAGKYQDRRLANRVFALASTHAQVVLQQLNASEVDAQLFCRIAGSILYAHPGLRASQAVLASNQRGQSGLWGYSVSGDLPIVLLQIGDLASLDIARQLIQAHAYWRLKGLAVDLVIWNDDRAGYRQVLQEQILELITAGVASNVAERAGSVFARALEQVSAEDRILFQSVARVILSDSRGTLAEQVGGRIADVLPEPARSAPARLRPARRRLQEAPAAAGLVAFNGIGGFSPDGREYVIVTGPETSTPAPWVNVLANAKLGSVVSESGSAYTWAGNAHEFRVSPWANDPVCDPSGEVFYIRDEDSGRFWSPTPRPAGSGGRYTTRHGFGYTTFEHDADGIVSELRVFVDVAESVKWSVLTIRNRSGHAGRLSVTGYVEWVLGGQRSSSGPFVVTSLHAETGAVLARNTFKADFAGLTAFFHVDHARRCATGDRTEFLGRNGTPADPAAMRRVSLSGRMGGAWDPCAALRVFVDLEDGESREVVFRLGVVQEGGDVGHACRPVGPASAAARAAFEAVTAYWARTLGTVQVETPDPAVNDLTNGWLLYQVLACRLWGRSGFYQSGGAFGFRDQLQDVMALVHAAPGLARHHLLVAAARQFRDGDVQHWWHPPSGRGVRTDCSDDLLWLAAATVRYVRATGDEGVLDEHAPFLDGRPLNPGESSYYDLPSTSDESGTLYEHCIRAIERRLVVGAHGLPLMGSGDWNDGMDRVGALGSGESVWLGFFLYSILLPFADLASRRGDKACADRCLAAAAALRVNLEEHGWDGHWYRRAYFDDGTPLGSASNVECQIDSIAQSWAVLSGAAMVARARGALDAVDARLVNRRARLVRLLDPPFDQGPSDPGYIKGYVPGVRENGGQYTHGAVWVAMAFAALGDDRAWDIWRLINPVAHGASSEAIDIYKVEPYVMAGDVYAVAPHVGRGGWTWYTGSAAWMYRLVLESLLGFSREGNRLTLAPLLPADWKGYSLRYRYGETVYRIEVQQLSAPTGSTQLSLDGVLQTGPSVLLVDDGRDHRVDVSVCRAA